MMAEIASFLIRSCNLAILEAPFGICMEAGIHPLWRQARKTGMKSKAFSYNNITRSLHWVNPERCLAMTHTRSYNVLKLIFLTGDAYLSRWTYMSLSGYARACWYRQCSKWFMGTYGQDTPMCMIIKPTLWYDHPPPFRQLIDQQISKKSLEERRRYPVSPVPVITRIGIAWHDLTAHYFWIQQTQINQFFMSQFDLFNYTLVAHPFKLRRFEARLPCSPNDFFYYLWAMAFSQYPFIIAIPEF